MRNLVLFVVIIVVLIILGRLIGIYTFSGCAPEVSEDTLRVDQGAGTGVQEPAPPEELGEQEGQGEEESTSSSGQQPTPTPATGGDEPVRIDTIVEPEEIVDDGHERYEFVYWTFETESHAENMKNRIKRHDKSIPIKVRKENWSYHVIVEYDAQDELDRYIERIRAIIGFEPQRGG